MVNLRALGHRHGKRRQRGAVMMMELLLGSIILAGVFGMYQRWKIGHERDALLERAAAMDKKVAEAVNAYIAENYEILTDQYTSGQVCDATVRTDQPWPAWKRTVKRIGAQYIDDATPGKLTGCTGARPSVLNPDWAAGGGLCSDNQCVGITLADLRASNFLEAASPDQDEFGSEYAVVVRRSGTAPYYQLDALIATAQPTYRKNGIWLTGTGNILGSLEDASYRAAWSGKDGAVVRPVTAADQAFRPTLPAAGTLAAFGMATKGIDALGAAVNALGWSENSGDTTVARRWPNLTAEAQVVIRAGYKSSVWGSYLRRDGSLPMTGDLNMDGNNIRKVGFAELTMEAPIDGLCNRPSGSTPAERAPVGALARAQTGANALGEGIMLACQMDVPSSNPLLPGTYKWKKATTGVETESDLRAGLFAGYETSELMACLSDGSGNWIGGVGSVPAYWSTPSQPKWTKWVIGKDELALYVQISGVWYKTLSRVYANVTTVLGRIPASSGLSFYNVASEVNTTAFCTSPIQDPYNPAAVGTGGSRVLNGIIEIEPALLNIGPKSIQYHTKAIFARTAACTNTDAGCPAQGLNWNGGRVVSGVSQGSVDVPYTTCTTDALGNTSCSTSTMNVPVVTNMVDTGVNVTENRITSQIGQTLKWDVIRKSVDCVNSAGTLMNTC